MVDACARLVESVRSGTVTTAAGRWCEVVFPDDGWALWLWRGSRGFELSASGGRVAPPRSTLDAVAGVLGTDPARRQLAAGHPIFLDEAAVGPEASAAAVALGSPSSALAVLAAVRRTGHPPLGEPELMALAAAGRMCSAALVGQAPAGPAGVAPTATGTRAAPPIGTGLVADLRDSLSTIAGFAHTLIHSEHRLGRVERHRYHAVIERQALALAGTLDDIATVVGAPAGAGFDAASPLETDVFTTELAARLGTDDAVDLDAGAIGALPPTGDEDGLARALAGLARVVGATGSRVQVVGATGDTVGRIGVVAVVGHEGAAGLSALVAAVQAGNRDAVWSGRSSLAIAAAAVVAAAHGGALGAGADGDVIRIWVDLPLGHPTP